MNFVYSLILAFIMAACSSAPESKSISTSKNQEPPKFENVDSETVFQGAAIVKPIYKFERGGWIVRHAKDGKKYYQTYLADGSPIGSSVDAGNVLLYRTNGIDSTYSYTFFQKVHQAKNLYWPLIVSNGKLFEKPDHILGILPDPPNDYSYDETGLAHWSGRIWYLKTSDGSTQFHYIDRPLHHGVNNFSIFAISERDKLVFVKTKDVPTRTAFMGKVITGPERLYIQADGTTYSNINFQRYPSEAVAIAEIKKKEAKVEETAKMQIKQAALDKQKAAEAAQLQAENNKVKLKKQSAFINFIHQYGPNPESLSSFNYDVGVYCQYGGPRCQQYRVMYQNMERKFNEQAEAANQKRIWEYTSSMRSGGVSSEARTKCLQKLTESLNRHTYGKQDWHFDLNMCNY